MATRNELIADLLMGAAYADAQLDGRETEAVASCLAKAMDVEALPREMQERIGAFDPRGFDPVEAARGLGLEREAEKLQLIAFLAAVTDADESFDLDENAYLERVAGALGLARESYADFTVEILSVEELRAAGSALLEPPPLPPRAR